MSDTRWNVGNAIQRRAGDAGMTLPELLIAITILGLLVAVISSALVVTLRQESSTMGRLNVARSEQSVGMWLPGDLASAGVVSVEPDWSPCGQIEVDGVWSPTGVECPPLGLPAGLNALMLGWSFKDADGNVTYTNVSYQFYQDSDGTFSMARVECVSSGGAWACERIVVLRDLSPPPGRHAVGPGGHQAVLGHRGQPASCSVGDERRRLGARRHEERQAGDRHDQRRWQLGGCRRRSQPHLDHRWRHDPSGDRRHEHGGSAIVRRGAAACAVGR